MKRSKKMFTRITSMLHNAVEALAPEMTLLEQFRYHWKCVTQFFLDTSDERVSVESTAIPHHLEQMINVLQQEEQENGTASAGPSMEFMLQHKILETMQTLGKADCPPGMKRYVLVFFTNLLGKSRQQLLPHVNVHKPVNKLIRCCGKIKAAPTETEEVQFLLQVSSKLKQDSYLVNFFLEAPSTTESGSSPPLSPGMEREREKPEYSLVDALIVLTNSEDSRVAIKACEGLLLCTSIPEDQAASVIVLYTAFCERMADQLAKLFRGLPAVIDPADMNQLSTTWGFDHEDQAGPPITGKRQMIAFFSWLDYVNQLSVEAHSMVSKALAGAIRERFILTAIEPGLSQASEPCAITVTAVLTRCLRLVSSATLAQEFADILLGHDTNPEQPDYQSPHKLRHLLIQRINHLSDQLAVETLRLFQALLQLSYQPIIDTLVVRNFTNRSYIDWKNEKQSEKTNIINVDTKSNNDNNEILEKQNNVQKQDIEKKNNVVSLNDHGIDNTLPEVSNVAIADEEKEKNNTLELPKDSKSKVILEENNLDKKVEKKLKTSESVDNTENEKIKDTGEKNESDADVLKFELNINDDITFSKKKVEKVVNGFLLILPDTLKTSQMVGETGYDSYLRDAHKQCQQRAIQTFSFDWPNLLTDGCLAATTDDSFYEGAFLHTIFKRLQRILAQPFEINLEVTAIISTLCQFRHPYLHEFLMDTSGVTKDSILTPHRILQKICQDVRNRTSRISNFQTSLLNVRKNLIGLSHHTTDIPDEAFMEGVIVLEEFCKELAAIAFVTATMEQSQDI
ncbi:FHF complex subunit HOOK interacting protein 2A-like [Hydractinia symbiolongicarpus]|uniref:FHF complex subunit HOOK interacting protein 2A-like n=1 Tax=Hydractinia symbiolongicarpus TaxID=13093 RepID=UPI00255046EB|nr:FHF complex subunit HOOK interacting protein 2A-like [Hydractinia symbiolongicarpus]